MPRRPRRLRPRRRPSAQRRSWRHRCGTGTASSPSGRTAGWRRRARPSACPPARWATARSGHLNLGAGFRVLQDLPRISAAIADGTLLRQRGADRGLPPSARAAAAGSTSWDSSGPGGSMPSTSTSWPWSSWRTVAACRRSASCFHAFTDGRDTPPRSADAFLPELEARFAGRARDRDRQRPLLGDGPRPALGSDASVPTTRSSTATGLARHDRGGGHRRRRTPRDEGDEFIQPTVIARRRADGGRRRASCTSTSAPTARAS